MPYKLTYRQFSERSLLIQWPSKINEAILKDINQFKSAIELSFKDIHTVASYCELLLEFNHPIDGYNELIKRLSLIYSTKKQSDYTPNLVRIPVCYDAAFGIDQEQLCAHLTITKDELIKLHTKSIYTVYSIGFLPGFMYLGGLNKRLYHPRLKHPREKVPKGSVGIAGMQTGIYPQQSPGGWQLIGRSPLELFQINKQPPTVVKVGDKIQFYAISMSEFELISIQLETDLFQIEKSPYHD